MITPTKAIFIECFEQKLDFMALEREYIVRESIDQPFVKLATGKRETAARKATGSMHSLNRVEPRWAEPVGMES